MKEKFNIFKMGFVQGLGWSFGVTIGFVIISTLIVYLLKLLGGMPFIGNIIAGIVEQTQKQLMQRTPLY